MPKSLMYRGTWWLLVVIPPLAHMVVTGTLVRWILEASYEVKTVRGIECKDAPESSIHGRLLADDGLLVWVVLEKLTADDVVEIS